MIFPPTPVSTSKANSPCASCDAKLLGFAVCDAKPPASRNRSVKPTDIWLATTGDEIPKLSEIWNRSLFSESTYREDLTDRVRSAVRRRRSFATTFSSKIGLFGSEFHPCNYPWQFRHCDDTKNCAPICIRSPVYVSRETRQNWKIFQRNVSRGTRTPPLPRLNFGPNTSQRMSESADSQRVGVQKRTHVGSRADNDFGLDC